jgi:hypothetical protein
MVEIEKSQYNCLVAPHIMQGTFAEERPMGMLA